jgi:hypothetical protein
VGGEAREMVGGEPERRITPAAEEPGEQSREGQRRQEGEGEKTELRTDL